MLGAALLQRLVQLVQELALVFGELDRRFDRDMAIQVAGIAGTHALDTLAAQAELLACLSALGNVDRRLALQGGHLDLAAQRRPRETDRYHAMQVVAVALEDLVLLEPDLDVQVTRRPAVGARLAVAGAADAHAVVDAGGNLHFQRLLLLDAALAMAGGAGLGNDLARAAAVRAGLLHAEKTLAHLHHALAVAGAAGLGLRAG